MNEVVHPLRGISVSYYSPSSYRFPNWPIRYFYTTGDNDRYSDCIALTGCNGHYASEPRHEIIMINSRISCAVLFLRGIFKSIKIMSESPFHIVY